MKKLVLRLELEDGKAKQKAMRTVSTLQGIDSIVMDMKEKKMTVIGTVDPVHVVSKLRKYWLANIITVGPAKEPEKKEEPKPAPAAAEEGKKEEGKKEEGKKEEGKEEGGGKKEEGKGEEKKEEGKKEEGGGGGGKKEEGGGEGGGGGKKEEGEAAPKKPPQMMPQPIPEHLLEMVRARQYNPYMGNYPPYMAMPNPYMNHHHHPQIHPQMYHHHQMHHPQQPTYYVQSVEENPNGCTIF